MPWNRSQVKGRKSLIALWEAGETVAELARVFSLSRPTVYTAIERWLEEGKTGLENRSRRPNSNPRQTSPEVTAALLTLKDKHRNWGPDKLVRLLRNEGIELPASTARDVLNQNGRVQARRARPARWSPASTPKIVIAGPGHSMSADYKGAFRLGNGQYCHPLTIADPASRYIFAIEAMVSTAVRPALKVFKRVFLEWGLPEQIITDNGVPFCSARSIGGLTELSKFWIQLGIQHVRITPGRPQENGTHERMHLTLGLETTDPPEKNPRAQQRRFHGFREEFDHVRPHQALGQEIPASRVKMYRRPYPSRILPMEYPSSFDVRRVRVRGNIKWKGGLLFISEVLRGELIAMLQVEDHLWKVFYGPVHLATWNERTRKFEAPSPA